ncbi:MAG: energy transducer TonB [Betaproteobacteria bacterium]|nr:energy transducer TonB [Betaproteobacteria bacterium]
MATKLSFLSFIWNPDRGRRLTIGFVGSVTIHILILLIQFTLPERPLASTPSLDVILVNARHDTAPKIAQALAQANLDGGGDSSENIRATSPLLPQESMRDGNDLIDMVRGQQTAMRQPQQEQILTQQDGTFAVSRPEFPDDKPSKPMPATGTDVADAVAMALQLEAEIAERQNAYNQRPRTLRRGPATRAFAPAQYIADWCAKVQRIADLNYPAAARGKMYDTLVMQATIKKDGSVKEVVIRRPSKYPVLNEAAKRSVELGEPYAQLPPAITKDWDEIEITTTWSFTNDKLGVVQQTTRR